MFHQEAYNYIKQQATLRESTAPIKEGSVHVQFPTPDPEDAKITKKIETEFHRLGTLNGLSKTLSGLRVSGS